MSKCPMCGTPATFEIRLPEGASIPCASLTEANGLLRTHQRQWPNEDLSIVVVASPNTDTPYALELQKAAESVCWCSSNSDLTDTAAALDRLRAALAKNPNPAALNDAVQPGGEKPEASGTADVGPAWVRGGRPVSDEGWKELRRDERPDTPVTEHIPRDK